MSVTKLKSISWKPRYEFLKMHKKRPVSDISGGIAGEEMHSGGCKFACRRKGAEE